MSGADVSFFPLPDGQQPVAEPGTGAARIGMPV